MTETQKVEAIIRDLENKRREIVEKGIELTDERQRIAFSAHTGDSKARKRLDEINSAMASHASEVAGIEAAIVEATARLDAAHCDAALAADREAAQKLSKELAVFEECASEMDAALEDFVNHAKLLEQTLITMNQLGAQSPSRAQLDSLGARALLTALQRTPWAREFSPLPPRERITFAALVEGWRASVRNNIAQRLGQQQEAA